jgi:hypothetical protein
MQRLMRTKQTKILFLTIALGVGLPCLAQTTEPFEVRRAEAVCEELQQQRILSIGADRIRFQS